MPRFLLPALLAILASLPGAVQAHEERGSPQYFELYEALLHSIRQTDSAGTGGAPFVYFGEAKDCRDGQCYYFSGDAVSAIVDRAIAELEAGSRETDPEAAAVLRARHGWLRAKARAWLAALGKFGLEIPSVAIQGIRQYGVSYVVYTLVTEVVEHLLIPHPAFCKVLQGFYVSTIDTVSRFAQVCRNVRPGEDGAWRRVQAAYLAVRAGRRFEKRIGRRAYTGDPSLGGGVRQAELKAYLGDPSHGEAAFAVAYLAESTLWAEVLVRMPDAVTEDSGALAAAAAGLPAQLQALADEESQEARAWGAYRVSALLEIMSGVLTEGITARNVENAATLGRLDRWLPFAGTYWRFLGDRGALGELGKLIDLFRNALYAEAFSAAGGGRFALLARFTNEHMIPVLELGRGLIAEAPGMGRPELVRAVRAAQRDLKVLLKAEACLRLLE